MCLLYLLSLTGITASSHIYVGIKTEINRSAFANEAVKQVVNSDTL